MNKYKGKICPFCKTSFLEDDEVVVCDICEMPHHKDCWFENGQCTTFGCTGKIKDLLPFDQNSASVATPTQSQAQSQPQAQATFVPPAQSQAQAAFVPPARPQQTYSAPAAQPQQQQSFAFCIYCGNKYVVGDMFCRKCGKKIQNAAPISKEEQDKRDYEQAVKLLEAQRFDEALQIFTKLADYSDSKEKAKLCVQGKENARKERLYLSAIAVLSKQRVSDTEIKNAIEALTSIEDYKDAKAKISDLEKMLEKWNEAKKAAEEAARKRQYETAVSYVSSGLFDEAIKIFTDLGEYADCKAQIEKTLEAKETARKEQLYTKSLAVLTAESLTESELKEAIEALKSIEDYKDSKEKIPEVEARLEKWYEDKAAAEEAERIRKAKARAKAKKITILSSIAAVFVAIIIVGIVFVTKTYNIVYDLDGGTIENANESSYTLLTNDITLGKPSKEGYTFIGWTGTDLETPTLDVTISKWSLGNRDYKANWKANSYTITFDTVGGVGSESQSVTFDANTELPTPTKNGYTFAGWYVGDKLYSNGDWKDATDLTLTAKWTANDYTITLDGITEVHPGIVVTFNPNYSGASSTKTTLTNGQKLSYPTNPTRSGYVFTGWYTEAACSNKYNFSGNITADMTLYAGWKTLTITNNSSYAWSTSGSVLTSTNKGNNSSSEYRITATAPVTITFEYKTSSESGYDYLYIKKNGSQLKSCSGSTSYTSYSVTLATGDYLSFIYSKDGSGSNGSDCAYISNLTFTSTATQTSTAKASCTTNITYEYKTGNKLTQTATFDKDFTLPVPTRRGYAFLGWYNGDTKIEAGTWDISSDVTLTAKWEVGGNTITLDANGGTVSSNSVAAIFDKAFTLPTPTRTGYTFDGWFCGEKQYVSGTWNEVDDVTLVAKWTANQYTVTFDDTKKKDVVVTYNYNYSGTTATTVTLHDGDALSYPTAPTRSGYVFTGWYTDSSCTTRYDFTGTISDDMTLYAGWTEMSMSYVYSEYSVNPTTYSSSSNPTSVSTYGTSSSSKIHMYVVAEEAGTHYIYYKNYSSYSSYKYYIQIYNLTTGTTILSNTTVSSTSYSYEDFNCAAGDVIVVSIYKYSSSSYNYSDAYFYFEGFSAATSSAVVSAANLVPDADSTYSETVTFGEDYTLPTLSMTGHTFIGWYNGETKVESGAWNIASNVTLTPQWDAAKNTITLDAKGGTVSNTTVSVTYGVAYTLPTPERTGYTFDGWFSGSNQYTSGTWDEEADVTLEAKWTANTYNITYSDVVEMRGGATITLDYGYSGSTPTIIELENGDVLDYPTVPTRSNYAFAGWYTNSSYTTPYNFDETITEDITLYAKWESMQSSSYGSSYFDVSSYTSSSQQKSVTASSYSGYNYYYFTCYKDGTYTIYATWIEGDFKFNVSNETKGTTIISNYNLYSSSTSTSQSFTASAGDVICVRTTRYSSSYNYTSNGKFYVSGASYPTSSATVSCGTIDGFVYDAGSSAYATVEFDSTYTPPTPIRTGYTFLGWYNGENKIEEGLWSIDSNVTLVPQWELKTNTITLDPNGGTVSNTAISVTYGESYTLPTLSRTGYTFDGWFSDNTQYTSGTWNEESDVTLKAKWSLANYTITYEDVEEFNTTATITFNYNYSGSTVTTTTLTNGQTLVRPSTPTRSGYVFTGWYTNASCTIRYDFSGSITEDFTLYAGWKEMSLSNVYSETQIDPSMYTTSSNYYYVSVNSESTTYSKKVHTYLVAEETGTHYIYYSAAYTRSYCMQIYNLTTNTYIMENTIKNSTSYSSVSFNCEEGDVIVISLYYYGSSGYYSYDNYVYFYFSGFDEPKVSTATASLILGQLRYNSNSTYTDSVEYNENYTLPVPTRAGYTFLGWYNGNTKVESGTWNINLDVTLTPKWQ